MHPYSCRLILGAFALTVIQLQFGFVYFYISTSSNLAAAETVKINNPPSNYSTIKRRTVFTFSDDCQCRSLFKMSLCESGVDNLKLPILPYEYKNLLKNLNHGREKDPDLFMKTLLQFAKHLPRVYTLGDNFKVNNVSFLDLKNNSKILMKSKENVAKHITTWPYCHCKIRRYTPSLVNQCLERINRKIGRPVSIAFIGDSMVRQTLEDIVEDYKEELHLRPQGESEIQLNLKFLDHKLKVNLPILGDNIHLRLFWAPYMEKYKDAHPSLNDSGVSFQGAFDVLNNWYYNNFTQKDGPLPDLILASNGLWSAYKFLEDEWPITALDDHALALKTLSPIIKNLSSRTRILWNVHHKVKKGHARNDQVNAILELMNMMEWYMLSDSNLWFWESQTVLALRNFIECRVYREMKIDRLVPSLWKCFDWQHPGYRARKTAVNMIWNMVCNREMESEEKYCCS